MTKPAPFRAALFLLLFAAAAGPAAAQAQDPPAGTQAQPRDQPVETDVPDPAEADPPPSCVVVVVVTSG
jgi:hypothetical protein